jgi:hypothetical protein
VGSSGRRHAAAALFLLAASRPALAYRPFDTTDAAVASTGEVEIELAPLGYLKEGATAWIVAPSAILNWGFAQGWEAVLEGRQFLRVAGPSSEARWTVDDIAFSLKGVLREGALQEKSGPSVATELSALLPTVRAESGAGAEWALIASQRWPDLTVHLDGAASWTRAHRLGLLASAIVEIHDAWKVRPVAEVVVEGERGAPTVVSGLAGAIWRVTEDLALDAAVRVARGGGTTTTELRAGVTWAFAIGFPGRRER